MAYTIGLDYGTNSVRGLIVDTNDGRELGTCVYEYETGQAGIMLDPSDHNVARQNPADYLKGIEVTISGAMAQAKKTDSSFDPSQIIGIGVDTTGSTPIPVDADGIPLALKPEFKDNLNAYVWLWKDHTGHAEAAPRLPNWPKRTIPNTWPSAAASIHPNGFLANSCIVCGLIQKYLMRPIHGSSMPTGLPAY